MSGSEAIPEPKSIPQRLIGASITARNRDRCRRSALTIRFVTAFIDQLFADRYFVFRKNFRCRF